MKSHNLSQSIPISPPITNRSNLKLFTLSRQHDVSGVSGTGIVAEGVRFSDGTVVLKWLRNPGALAFYPSIEDMLSVHGHRGYTQVLWEG